MTRTRNFTPGPVEISEEVLAAQYGQQQLHVGARFAETYNRTSRNLAQIFGTSGYVALMPGSGVLANEVALRAMLSPGQTALIIDAGYFSTILRYSVEGLGANAVMMPVEDGRPADPDLLRDTLRMQAIDLVCFTHVETSTGLLNPIRELAQVARAAGVPVFVDSVSALGTSPAKMDEYGISIMTSGSQKGLESVPGLGIVAVADDAWERIENTAQTGGGFTDLRRWKTQYETASDWHPSLTTMPVACVNALDVATRKILSEGLDARFARHIEARDFLCAAMTDLGFEMQIEQGHRAPGVTAIKIGGRFASSDLVRQLIYDHAIQIAGGFGPNKEHVFRVAHIGDHASPTALRAVVSGIAEVTQHWQ